MTHREANHNLSNLDTPGFVSRNTDFKSILLQAQANGAPQHGKGYEAFMEEIGEWTPGVNVERELARLSQASMEQAALVRLLSDYYRQVRMAATEGKG